MKNARSKKYRRLQILRIASQVFFLGFFFVLLFGTHFTGVDYIGPVEGFFHFDPFLAVVTSLAARALGVFFAWSAATILVTLLFGRVVCGWVCPLGAIHQFFSWIFKKSKFLRPKKPASGGLWMKYAVLAFVLVAALFGLNLAGYLDPLAFLTRTSATGLLPALGHGLNGLIGAVYAIRLEALGNTFAQAVERLTLNPIFQQGFVLGVIFLGFIVLNKWRERFFCRSICPTGALLGLFSRFNLLKLHIDGAACISCNLCSIHCPTQAGPFPNDQWKSSECVYCETCAAICPTAAISFPARLKKEKLPAVDFSRRRLLAASFLAFFSVPFFRISQTRIRANEKLIRPPGALPEPDFLAKCVKCGECMKACPTNGLQPALSEAGPEGVWTPVLVPKIGYCEYYCSLCSQVCPTGAIKELSVPEKTTVKIGTAWINKNRCIPYFLGRPCIVCEEHCPVSPKAIKFVMVETKLADGTTATEKAPVIDLDLCIGCGICE
ncbi:MAG: 4Fe-4S binding protein, partial [Candidatus Aminicenantales bacterium]